ncbi:MAG: hypothetical protein ACLP50_14600 [Solirubrobacteraceae bacterium]
MTRTYTQQQRERAAERAARQLMRHGLHPGPWPLLSPPAIAWLAEIAAHLHTLDPITIGAGAILETSGHDRCHEQLSLPTL